MVEDYSRACQRERGKKKEEEEKSPEKNTSLRPGFEPTDSVSRAMRAIYPLGHGALPNFALIL